MVWENPARVEQAIKRLTRENEEIDKFLYGRSAEKDRIIYMSMLEQKRDGLVRSAILQIHTAIDDLLTEMILGEVLGTPHNKAYKKFRTKRGEALADLLTGGGSMGFHMKLNFAVVVGVISPMTRDKLKELNSIRNKCGHHWLLDVAIRRGKKRGFNFPAHRNLRVSEGVENLLR